MELTPLQLAAACGHGEVIKTICGNPLTQVNVADPLFSMTALHLAVHLGQVFAVEALCKDRRVEVDEKNVEGKTAMHVAVAHEYTGIVETILRLHPNIDLRIKDFDGNNVFHLAAYHPNVKIMTLLTNHASMVNLYCEYFDITKISSKNKPRSKKQIFEVNYLIPTLQSDTLMKTTDDIDLKSRGRSPQAANYNGETAARILKDSIQRVQKRRADIEAKVARHEAQLREQATAGAFSGGGLLFEDLGLSMVPSRAPPVLTMASPITTDERSDGTFVEAVLPPVPSNHATQPTTQPVSQPYVPPNEPESGLTISSLQNSPFPEDEEQDVDTLIQCLEVIQSAAQVSPADESLSSFGHHSASGAGVVERKCSFDLDSNASQAGDNGNDEDDDEEEEEEGLQRTACSYSPPFTPSLDQDQPDPYFTPKSPKSSIRSKSSASSLS